MDNEKLALSFSTMQTDIHTVHSMVGLVRRLCVELPLYKTEMLEDDVTSNNHDCEELTSAILALDALTGDLVEQWSTGWKAAGGRD